MAYELKARARLRCSLAAAAFLLAALSRPTAAAAAPATNLLAQIEAALADVRTVRTRFVQEKRLALFKNPLVTRGVILLEMPDRLLWRVDTPIRYALLLDGRQARQWDGETGKTQRIPLDGNPVFAAVTEQLRAWFGGRYSQLAADYEIVQRSTEPAVFAFTPKKGTPPAALLRSVTVAFRSDNRYIASIRIDETGGDATTLTFEETTVNTPVPPREWEL